MEIEERVKETEEELELKYRNVKFRDEEISLLVKVLEEIP